MKKILNFLKKNRLPVPIRFGLVLAKIPYSKRPGLGKLYQDKKQEIARYEQFNLEEQKDYLYQQFMKIFVHAFENIKFYQDIYNKHQITPSEIRCYEDIAKVPIITKHDLLNYNLEDRSYPLPNRLLVNTGGSSGKSLSFYMDSGRYGNEWSHIHHMWSKLGYSPTDLKLSFDGRAKKNNAIVYDFARNSLLYDIYADPKEISKSLLKIIKKFPVKFLHGYPSAIYEFALYCEKNDVLLNILRKQLKGGFLSSEYPSPHYRSKIESVFEIPTQSFYGHTETCVMAYEESPFVYKTYQTYGLAESVEIEGKFHLVGTSYYNYASPLIRYDTSDVITPLDQDELILSSFEINEGRSGEFIVDQNNRKIPLTGLIYGRHHELFNCCEHIQISQNRQGQATIYYVSKEDISEENASKLFNSESVNIQFDFKKIEKPFLTSSGKINLLIRNPL